MLVGEMASLRSSDESWVLSAVRISEAVTACLRSGLVLTSWSLRSVKGGYGIDEMKCSWAEVFFEH